jgi:hypothetical protein
MIGYDCVSIYMEMNEWTWWVARLKGNMKIEEKLVRWNNDIDHCGMSKREKNEGHIFCMMVTHTQLYESIRNEHCDKRLSDLTASWNSSWIETSVPSPTVSLIKSNWQNSRLYLFFEQPCKKKPQCYTFAFFLFCYN